MNDTELRKEQEAFAVKQLPRAPIVWIPQKPMWLKSGQWHSKEMDFSSANEFGKVEVIWAGPPSIVFDRLEMETRALDMAELYDDQQDYILALGSPTLIAIFAWAVGQENKELHMLEWDKGYRRYYPTFRRKGKKDGTGTGNSTIEGNSNPS